MRLLPAVIWQLEGTPAEALDTRVMPLLSAIAASGSIAAAVRDCGISYRAAWGLLRDYQRKLGEPLVLLERGRGASLTRLGERLIDADRTAMRRLGRRTPELVVETASAHAERTQVQHLQIAASHDLALAALADTPPGKTGLALEISFTGSLHAIAAFAEGRVRVAGFHVPISGRAAPDRELFVRGLHPKLIRLIRFVDREQGLMVAKRNRRQVRNLRDIVSLGLRFINRQRGSGTRVLIDHLLEQETIDPTSVAGYSNEEFTHRAIAATVASGGADVGFGLRAAAAEYHLAFVPLVQERYFLAVHAKDLQKAPIVRLIQTLQSPAFGRIARRFPGYRAETAGAVLRLDAISGAEDQ